MTYLKKIFIVTLSVFVMSACVNKVENLNNKKAQIQDATQVTKTPYATSENLKSLEKTEDLVNPKIARFFAQTTKYEAALKKEWLDTNLSKTPLVIYHTNTQKPKFYEYRILDENNKEIGAIVSSADKSDGIVVRYFLEKSRQVTEEVAQKLSKGEWRLVDAGYPENFLAQDTNNNFYKASSGEKYQLTRDDYPEQSALDYYKNTSEEKILADFKVKEINSKAIIQAKDEAQKLVDAGKKMWQQIDAQEAEILKVTDYEIQQIFVDAEKEKVEDTIALKSVRETEAYNNYNLEKDSSLNASSNIKILNPTPIAMAAWYGFGKDLIARVHRVSYVAKPWDEVAQYRPSFFSYNQKTKQIESTYGYCGPYIINYITLGLAAKTPIGNPNVNYNLRVIDHNLKYPYYIKYANKNDLYDVTTTIYKNTNSNKNLFYSIADSNSYRVDNMYNYIHTTIGDGALCPCNIYKYIQQFTDNTFTAAHYYGHHNWYKARNHIRSYNLPLVTLRSSKWTSADWHYRTIVGTSVIRSIYRHRFMWWKWNSSADLNWYQLHDNGSDGGQNSTVFWEYSYQYYNLSMIGIYNPKDL